MHDSYHENIKIAADCARVYQAIATKRGLAGWWTHLVDGARSKQGNLAVSFEGMDQQIDLKADRLVRPAEVNWTCLRHSAFPEWRRTRMVFRLKEISAGNCELSFSHEGLTPQLDCYQEIRTAWKYFLRSLAAYVESGRGKPFRK